MRKNIFDILDLMFAGRDLFVKNTDRTIGRKVKMLNGSLN